ncbi:hypothetical protein FQN52_008839 [Onygenales sp. PD_12]|nr:hypothetical protein FQN52_008839 [Onygenales sp. PD_12]
MLTEHVFGSNTPINQPSSKQLNGGNDSDDDPEAASPMPLLSGEGDPLIGSASRGVPRGRADSHAEIPNENPDFNQHISWSFTSPRRHERSPLQSWIRRNRHARSLSRTTSISNPNHHCVSDDLGPAASLPTSVALRTVLLHSWVNVLLVFVPAGIAASLLNFRPSVIFTLNIIAIIPLSGLLTLATENLAYELGDTIGALLNATASLVEDQIRIVQASLIGSILVNLLLILGTAILIGGIKYREQVYNNSATEISTSLLCLAAFSLLIPTVFHEVFKNAASADRAVLTLSRATSVILLGVYPLYLVFQLKSHAYLYNSVSSPSTDGESVRRAPQSIPSLVPTSRISPLHLLRRARSMSLDPEIASQPMEMSNSPAQSVLGTESQAADALSGTVPAPLETQWQTHPSNATLPSAGIMSTRASIVLMIISTGLIAINAELLVNSINDMAKNGPINEAFIGLIILPVASNAAEHITAMSVAAKNNMDLAIGVSVGSSIQIGLYITPFVVIVGWILGKDMSLRFSQFETVTLLATVFLVNFLVLNGRSNYLKGAMLCACYFIIS